MYVLADAHRPPFRRGAFDTVVTPWLVDILPERFDVLCARVNALLADGGRWLNFGSLSFHDADPAARYGLDECRAALEENGFGDVAVDEREIPYLSSPASRHARRERVVSWSARKQRDVKKVPRYHALPEWLVRGTEPVPLGESFRSQAAATRIHAFLMSLIDGRRSIKDMAKLVVEQRLMTADEAEPAIRSFLIKMHDDAAAVRRTDFVGRRSPGLANMARDTPEERPCGSAAHMPCAPTVSGHVSETERPPTATLGFELGGEVEALESACRARR